MVRGNIFEAIEQLIGFMFSTRLEDCCLLKQWGEPIRMCLFCTLPEAKSFERGSKGIQGSGNGPQSEGVCSGHQCFVPEQLFRRPIALV